MTELPIVVVDVQRGGPSTGLPTKSEQGDLNQALYGRNGECSCIVIAATSPSDCFYSAFTAAKLAMEHMTPTILLTDGYIGQGSELFRIPKMADMPQIVPPIAEANDPDYAPYRRDPETLVRKWALPGTEGLRHRIGGLEKTDVKGAVSTDPLNHEKMVQYRRDKVLRVANDIPEQEVFGEKEGDLLVVSWGGTYGQTMVAVKEMQQQGQKVSLAHFKYSSPLPKNTAETISSSKTVPSRQPKAPSGTPQNRTVQSLSSAEAHCLQDSPRAPLSQPQAPRNAPKHPCLRYLQRTNHLQPRQ